MARIRTIKPEFWSDEKVVECSMPARLFFIGTWNFADDNGNLPRSAKQLKMQVFPGDIIDTEPLIQELLTAKLMIEYASGPGTYLHIPGFHKHQKIDRPGKASIPEFYPETEGSSTNVRRTLDECSTNVRRTLDTEGRKEGMEVKEGSGEKKTKPAKNAGLSDDDFFASLKENPAYRGIDIDRELGKMRAWALTHPGRKITRRFAVAWLNKIEPPMTMEADDGYYLTDEQIAECVAFEDQLEAEMGKEEYAKKYLDGKKVTPNVFGK